MDRMLALILDWALFIYFPYLQQDAAQWFFSQPYIDKSRIGAVGLCFGGCLSLMLAAYIPQVSVSRLYSGPLITQILLARSISLCRRTL